MARTRFARPTFSLFWLLASPLPVFPQSVPAHLGPVQAMAFSPQARLLASAGSDQTLKLWDPRRGVLVTHLETARNDVTCGLASPDGDRFVAGTGEGLVKVWRIHDGALLHALRTGTRPLTSIDLEAKGRYALVADARGRMSLWDLEEEAELSEYSPAGHPWAAVALSPDGRLLAGADSGGRVRVWSREGALVGETRLGGRPQAICFSAHHLRAAGNTSLDQGVLWEWQPRDRSGPSAHQVYPRALAAATFSADGQSLAAATRDHHLLLLTPAGRSVSPAKIDGLPSVLRLSPDRRHLGMGKENGQVELWDGRLSRLRTWRAHRGPVSALAFGASEILLSAAPSRAGRGLKAWRLPRARLLWSLSLTGGGFTELLFSSEARYLAARGSSFLFLWKIQEKLLWRTWPRRHQSTAWAFSPSSRLMLLGGQAGGVETWEFKSGRQELYPASGNPALSVAFLDSGPLASVSASGELRVWERGHKKPVREWASGLASPRLVSSGAGTRLLGEKGSQLQVWDLGKDPARLLAVRPSPSRRLEAPQGVLVPRAGGLALLWIDDLAERASFEDAFPDGATVATSPRGKMLVVSSEPGRVRLVSATSLARGLEDPTLLRLEVSARPSSIFRLDRAPLGEIIVRAGQACGSDRDGRCLTRNGVLLLSFQTAGRAGQGLRLEADQVRVESLPAGVVARAGVAGPTTLALVLPRNRDLAAGEELHLSQITVSALPRALVGKGAREWRWKPLEGGWRKEKVELWMEEYPRLENPISLTLSSLPRLVLGPRGPWIVARPGAGRALGDAPGRRMQQPAGSAGRDKLELEEYCEEAAGVAISSAGWEERIHTWRSLTLKVKICQAGP